MATCFHLYQDWLRPGRHTHHTSTPTQTHSIAKDAFSIDLLLEFSKCACSSSVGKITLQMQQTVSSPINKTKTMRCTKSFVCECGISNSKCALLLRGQNIYACQLQLNISWRSEIERERSNWRPTSRIEVARERRSHTSMYRRNMHPTQAEVTAAANSARSSKAIYYHVPWLMNEMHSKW